MSSAHVSMAPSASPTSPSSAKTTRVRIKASRHPTSLGNVSSEIGPADRARRTRSLSLSLSRFVTTDSDTTHGSPSKPAPSASRTAVIAKRRQSSIAYYTPSSPSPWSPRSQSNRTPFSGVNAHLEGEFVVPNARECVSHRSSLVLSPRSPSARDSLGSSDSAGAREREPLTLVEKYADLLHFIAQKERKCLELREQLASHENELAELKRRWERIVNLGYDSYPNLPMTAGLGGVALDGLKEGVRIITAGFSDLTGAIHEFESGDKETSKAVTHVPRDSYDVQTNQTGSQRPSTSSISSTHDVPERGEGETVATAASLARSGSLNRRKYKRASRAPIDEESKISWRADSQSPESTNLDVGMSLVLAPSPILVPSFKDVTPNSMRSPKSPVLGSAQGSTPTTTGSMSSWIDTMGKRLSGMQNGSTFSKSQKRASSILAGVSSTFVSALTPGPTATTPAPHPPLMRPRLSSLTKSPSMFPVLRQSPRTTPQRLPLPSQPLLSERHTAAVTKDWDWLDDDQEEETVRAGTAGVSVLMPDAKPPPVTPPSVSSFDDDWNW